MTTNTLSPALQKRMRRRRQDRVWIVVTVILVITAFILGGIRANENLEPALHQAMPEAARFDQESGTVFAGYPAGSDELLGYVVVGEASGYGGPLRLAVAINLDGEIMNTQVVDSGETPSWITRIMSADFPDELLGKTASDAFVLGGDIDGVTGATYTSRAMANAALNSSREAARILDLPFTEAESPSVKFGVPEMTLLALFVFGFVARQRKFAYKKHARWASMLVGLVILGFVYCLPLTLAYVVKLVLGYWPPWQTNLYFYFLMVGILGLLLVTKKNPYCSWFCPFGGAQECLGLVGGAKARSVGNSRVFLRWAQRVVFLVALLLGVYFRSPGLASYELFGTLFNFVGTEIQFIALAIVLLMALFIKRPWCLYICPLHSVEDFVLAARQWGVDLWQQIKPSQKTA